MRLLLPTAVQLWVSYFIWPFNREVPQTPPLTFSLRHEHALAEDSRVVFSDVPPSLAPTTYAVSTRRLDLLRPSSPSAFSNARTRSMRHAQTQLIKWDDVDTLGPEVESRETLLQLAKMTFNAYAAGPGKPSEWYELGEWNMVSRLPRVVHKHNLPLQQSYPFGWEPDADGFRGQVFVSDDGSTVVVSVKGTSAGWLVGGGGPTTRKDKLNDNLLFSCCCAKVGPTWSPVCDCHSGGYTCDQSCLERSLIEDSLFYSVGIVCSFPLNLLLLILISA